MAPLGSGHNGSDRAVPDDLCDCLIPYLEGAGQHSPGCAAVLADMAHCTQHDRHRPGCPWCRTADQNLRAATRSHATAETGKGPS